MTGSYSNPGGSGDRRNDILVTLTPSAIVEGDISELVNGEKDGSTDLFFWDGGTSNAVLTFDFGDGHTRIITQFKWYQDSAHSHGTFNFDGSNDNSSWTTLITGLNLGATVTGTFTCAGNTTAYRYYRLQQKTGTTSSSPFLYEIEFEIASGTDPTLPNATRAVGDRTSLIDMSTTFTLGDAGAAPLNNMINGLFGQNDTAGTWFASGQTNKTITFDFRAGIIIDKMALITKDGVNNGTYIFEASNDNTTFTQLGVNFGVTTECTQLFFTNTTPYRYYRIRGPVTGTIKSTAWFEEIMFSASEPTGGGGGDAGSYTVVVCIAAGG